MRVLLTTVLVLGVVAAQRRQVSQKSYEGRPAVFLARQTNRNQGSASNKVNFSVSSQNQGSSSSKFKFPQYDNFRKSVFGENNRFIARSSTNQNQQYRKQQQTNTFRQPTRIIPTQFQNTNTRFQNTNTRLSTSPTSVVLSNTAIRTPIQPVEIQAKYYSNFKNNQATLDLEPPFGVFEPLNLPSGATQLLGNIDTSFSCADRPYGYYADSDNRCAIFHICNPALFEDGTVQAYQYSFLCGEETVFDQDQMTCVELSAAIDCGDSPNYYWRNQAFGLPEEKNI